MSEKQNAMLTAAFIGIILLVFTVADFFRGDRLFSETENRLLAARPKFSTETLFSGEYGKAYEDYVTDQFPGRDKWIQVKTQTDLLLGHRQINGVYLGNDGYLLEYHSADSFNEAQEQEKIQALQKLVERWNARVMLVPTADNILTDKLPQYSDYYDETRLLGALQQALPEGNYIDVYSALKEHSKEEIYYRTDHHWTTLGAYYGYQAWAEQSRWKAYNYRTQNLVTVSGDFQGTLHSRLNMETRTDTIQYFPETEYRSVQVTYDMTKESDRLYEESYLDTKNQYGFFLDDNHAFVEIKSEYGRGKTLFVIKDSYANCFIPLMTHHYETIYVLDLRYFNGKLFSFMEEYEPEAGMDVLVLYNCVHFMEDFQYYE